MNKRNFVWLPIIMAGSMMFGSNPNEWSGGSMSKNHQLGFTRGLSHPCMMPALQQHMPSSSSSSAVVLAEGGLNSVPVALDLQTGEVMLNENSLAFYAQKNDQARNARAKVAGLLTKVLVGPAKQFDPVSDDSVKQLVADAAGDVAGEIERVTGEFDDWGRRAVVSALPLVYGAAQQGCQLMPDSSGAEAVVNAAGDSVPAPAPTQASQSLKHKLMQSAVSSAAARWMPFSGASLAYFLAPGKTITKDPLQQFAKLRQECTNVSGNIAHEHQGACKLGIKADNGSLKQMYDTLARKQVASEDVTIMEQALKDAVQETCNQTTASSQNKYKDFFEKQATKVPAAYKQEWQKQQPSTVGAYVEPAIPAAAGIACVVACHNNDQPKIRNVAGGLGAAVTAYSLFRSARKLNTIKHCKARIQECDAEDRVLRQQATKCQLSYDCSKEVDDLMKRVRAQSKQDAQARLEAIRQQNAIQAAHAGLSVEEVSSNSSNASLPAEAAAGGGSIGGGIVTPVAEAASAQQANSSQPKKKSLVGWLSSLGF